MIKEGLKKSIPFERSPDDSSPSTIDFETTDLQIVIDDEDV